jgi:hypothetical protein
MPAVRNLLPPVVQVPLFVGGQPLPHLQLNRKTEIVRFVSPERGGFGGCQNRWRKRLWI